MKRGRVRKASVPRCFVKTDCAPMERGRLSPGVTRSMQIAMADLQLDRLYVVYPGTLRYPLAERMEAVPLAALV